MDIYIYMACDILKRLSVCFSMMSFFAISSVLTLPFVLLFFFSCFEYLKSKERKYLFLIFLSLGFILETEVPFGLFIIPAFLLSVVLSNEIKTF